MNVNNNRIIIEDNVTYNTGFIGINSINSTIKIGANTTIGKATISCHESGEITIDKDCMLSIDIFMDNSDMHSLYNK